MKNQNLIDPYLTLKIPETATDEEIKKAYRKLAKEYHPDKNPNNKAAEEYFKEVNNAYEILSDPIRKAAYDSSRKTSYSYKSKSYQSHANTGNRKTNEQAEREMTEREQRIKKNEEAFETKRRQAEQEASEREQRIKNNEATLRGQHEHFKSIKKTFWTMAAAAAVVVGIALLLFVRYTNTRYQKLTSKNDSLSLELRSHEFLINAGLEKSKLQKVKSLMSIYDLNKKGIHDYTSFDVFLQEMRDKRKANELYDSLLKAKVPVNMNFDQFYKIVKLDN